MTKRWGVYMAAGIVAAVAGALVLAVGWYASGRVIHPPQDSSRYGPKDYDLPLENVQFQSRDGVQLVGWFIRGESSATVVLAQGRGSYKDHLDWPISAIRSLSRRRSLEWSSISPTPQKR